MTESILAPDQLRLLKIIFAKGAEDASRTLSKWLRSGIRLTIDEVEEVAIADATRCIGPADVEVTACVMTLTGRWTGKLIIAFEEESGLALVDMLLGRPLGSSSTWGELEESAALETGNVLGCAYLNSLTAHLPVRDERHPELVPSPPVLISDFAGSLLQTALMEQAIVSDKVLLVRTQFCRDETQLRWHLFFIPDPEALTEIAGSLEF